MVFSRRQLLVGAGASLLAGPFASLLGGRARAASTGSARRLLVLFSPNGTVHRHWRPSGSGRDFAFPAGSMLEPLAGLEEHLLVLGGLDFHEADNHEGGMSAMLTNNGGAADVGGGASIDQVIAAHLAGQTKFASMELGVQTSAWGGSSQTRMCYAGPGSYVTPDDSPTNVWNRMFGDLAGGEEAAAALRARRRSVIDLVKGEIDDLHRRLGAEERAKLDVHLDALRTVENSLSHTGTCEPGDSPPLYAKYDNDSFPDICRDQLDLAVEALACGFTNVASVQMSHTVGPVVMTWEGLTDGHHDLSHWTPYNGNAELCNTDIHKATTYTVDQFATLLATLQGFQEGDCNLLDQSVILFGSDLADGPNHTVTDMPVIVAGGGGGALRTPSVHYRSPNEENTSDILMSVLQAFDPTATEVGAAAGYSTTPVSAIMS